MTPLIVTDTSPLIAFERLGRLDLLPALYEVLAPEAVVREFGTRPPWLRLAWWVARFSGTERNAARHAHTPPRTWSALGPEGDARSEWRGLATKAPRPLR